MVEAAGWPAVATGTDERVQIRSSGFLAPGSSAHVHLTAPPPGYWKADRLLILVDEVLPSLVRVVSIRGHQQELVRDHLGLGADCFGPGLDRFDMARPCESLVLHLRNDAGRTARISIVAEGSYYPTYGLRTR